MDDNVVVISFWNQRSGACYANLFCSDAEQLLMLIEDTPDFTEKIKNALREKIGNSESVDEGNDHCLSKFEEFLNKNKEEHNHSNPSSESLGSERRMQNESKA